MMKEWKKMNKFFKLTEILKKYEEFLYKDYCKLKQLYKYSYNKGKNDQIKEDYRDNEYADLFNRSEGLQLKRLQAENLNYYNIHYKTIQNKVFELSEELREIDLNNEESRNCARKLVVQILNWSMMLLAKFEKSDQFEDEDK